MDFKHAILSVIASVSLVGCGEGIQTFNTPTPAIQSSATIAYEPPPTNQPVSNITSVVTSEAPPVVIVASVQPKTTPIMISTAIDGLTPTPFSTLGPTPSAAYNSQPSPTLAPVSTPIPTKSSDAKVPTKTQCKAGNSKGDLPRGGPYYHQVYRATSTDGLTFMTENTLLLDHASVPDAILRPDGEIWIYFVNGVPGQHGIWVARSSNTGSWEILDCVRLDGRFNGNAVDPDIVLLSDGTYRLFYYEGNFVKPGSSSVRAHPIFSAISDDGVNFTVESQLIAVEGVTDPSVIQLAHGGWLMALSQGNQTLLVSSDDGYEFNLTGVVTDLGGIPELALLGDGNVRLYVTEGGIKSLFSEDNGHTWVVEPGTRLSSSQGGIVADPSAVMTVDDGWILFYKVAPPANPPK